METTQHAFARLTPEQLCECLCALAQRHSHAVILFHARSDGDAVGSAFALRGILEQLGMSVRCLCADEVPKRLRFISEPWQASVAQKALPDAWLAEDVPVISVDTASPSQMGALAQDWQERVRLMIDHHESGTPYAEGWIEPQAAATGEMIFEIGEMLMAQGLIDSVPHAAYTAMYAAISSDTGSFRYTNVTGKTFAIAAKLREHGVDTAQISHALFESKPYSQLLAESIGFAAMQRWLDGRVAVIPFTYEMKQQNGFTDEDLETLVDVARMVEGVEIVLSVRQPGEEGRYRVSSRSSGAFCVSSLCARFGGGGHAKAAGCTILASSMDEVLSQLKAALDAELLAQNLD
jgi:phosphoesterase RecJ-like protein